jgi:hypothetical protein
MSNETGLDAQEIKQLLSRYGVKISVVAEKTGFTSHYVRLVLVGRRSNLEILKAGVEAVRERKEELLKIRHEIAELQGSN